nr:GrpB family protein [Actinoplanes durhamensis]
MRERLDPIAIIPYDDGWPASFERQRRRVAAALKPWIVGSVEHIGSTSVPGLAAKPIIDMVALVRDYQETDGVVDAMAGIGWVHAPEPGDEAGRKWSFCFRTSVGAAITCTSSRPARRTDSRCWPSGITCGVIPGTPPNTGGSRPCWPPPMTVIALATGRAKPRSSKGC